MSQKQGRTIRFPDGVLDVFDNALEEMLSLARGSCRGDVLGAGVLLLLGLTHEQRKIVMQQWMLRPDRMDLKAAESLGREIHKMLGTRAK